MYDPSVVLKVSAMSLDLVYFSGGPRLRVLEALIAAGHQVMEVIVNDPSRWPKVQPTIDLTKKLGVPVTVGSRKAELPALADRLRGRMWFSDGFEYVFPQSFLDPVGLCLNVHGSLLPKYPGARTLSWAIENGETQSGVTVHKVDGGVDTGPILFQRSFELSPFETTQSLARKTAAIEPQVVVDALAKYEKLGQAAFAAQPAEHAVPLPNRVPQHSQVDPSRSLLELFNKVRAANPKLYPAYFYLHGEKVCVHMWRPD